ncbi:MAG: hypothetical protein K2X81_26400 [Candidatus Obscuribacterales bacterium]|nr:hypothetical protein [Candidatus Obscuribacterales bacterium]
MTGMLQIITYLLGVYLIVKGIEVLQIGLASNRENRIGLVVIGFITLCGCTYASWTFVSMQDQQASSLSTSASPYQQ